MQLKRLPPYKIAQLDDSDEVSIVNAAKELENEAIGLLIRKSGIFLRGSLSATQHDLPRNFGVDSVGSFVATRACVPDLKLASTKNGGASVVQFRPAWSVLR